MTNDSENNRSGERPISGGYSRREALKLGGLATLGTLLGGGALLGRATPALAQASSAGTLSPADPEHFSILPAPVRSFTSYRIRTFAMRASMVVS